jgi:hypothetical protein
LLECSVEKSAHATGYGAAAFSSDFSRLPRRLAGGMIYHTSIPGSRILLLDSTHLANASM